IECHSVFADAGASASDLCAGSLPVSVSGSVNANTVGDYTLNSFPTRRSSDLDSKSRVIHVVDTTKPVVSLVQDDETIECHSVFADAGASASDLCAGSLPVSVSGSVDANTVGDYTLSYSATDPSGNSDSKSRVI